MKAKKERELLIKDDSENEADDSNLDVIAEEEVEDEEEVNETNISEEAMIEDKATEDERSNKLKLLEFYESALAFVILLSSAIPSLCSLLGSSNNSDVLEVCIKYSCFLLGKLSFLINFYLIHT